MNRPLKNAGTAPARAATQPARRRFLSAAPALAVAPGALSGPLTRLLAAPVLLSALPGAAAHAADAFPARAVRIIVPNAPGGTSDQMARLIAPRLQQLWKHPVVIENKPGADGNLGAELTAHAPADGYTLMLNDVSTQTMGSLAYRKLGFRPMEDFAPVTLVAFSPHALTVARDVPATTLPELIAWGRQHPEQLTFGSSSIAIRLAAARLAAETGMTMINVPYKGGAAALLATASGECSMTMASLLASRVQIAGGRVRLIGIAADHRMKAEPGMPTLVEQGLKDFVTGSAQGLFAPRGTPADVVARVHADVVSVLRQPDVTKALEDQGADVVADTPAHFGDMLRADHERWSRVVRDAGIRFD